MKASVKHFTIEMKARAHIFYKDAYYIYVYIYTCTALVGLLTNKTMPSKLIKATIAAIYFILNS